MQKPPLFFAKIWVVFLEWFGATGHRFSMFFQKNVCDKKKCKNRCFSQPQKQWNRVSPLILQPCFFLQIKEIAKICKNLAFFGVSNERASQKLRFFAFFSAKFRQIRNFRKFSLFPKNGILCCWAKNTEIPEISEKVHFFWGFRVKSCWLAKLTQL